MAANRLSTASALTTISRPSWATDDAVLEKILSPVRDGEDFTTIAQTARESGIGSDKTTTEGPAPAADAQTREEPDTQEQTKVAKRFDDWFKKKHGSPGGEGAPPHRPELTLPLRNLSNPLDDDIIVLDRKNQTYRHPDTRYELPAQQLRLYNRSLRVFVGFFNPEEQTINLRQRLDNTRDMISESSLPFFFDLKREYMHAYSSLIGNAAKRQQHVSLHNNGFWQIIHLPPGEAPTKEGRTPKPIKTRDDMSPQELKEADAWLREQDASSLRQVRAIVTGGTTFFHNKLRERAQKKKLNKKVLAAFERSKMAREDAQGLGALALSHPVPIRAPRDTHDDSSFVERNSLTAGSASLHSLSPAMTRETRLRSMSKVNTLPSSKSIGFYPSV